MGLLIFLFTWTNVLAAGIDATNAYAWGENVGWLNFGTSQGNVNVGTSALTGYAWGENVGWISLNCSNTSSCLTVPYGVTNDGSGNLSGYAWGENVGWISFSCANTSSCLTVSYGVTIDGSGNFSGFAYGENIGWVSFNCTNTSSCGTVSYEVALASAATAVQQTGTVIGVPAALPAAPSQSPSPPSTKTPTARAPQTAVPHTASPASSPPRFVPPGSPNNINGPLLTVAAPSANNVVQSGKTGFGIIISGVKTAAIAVGNTVISGVKKMLSFIGNLFKITPKNIQSPPRQVAGSSSSSLSVPQNIGGQIQGIFNYIQGLISPH